jgi:ABC-type amino acid transport substrate-binding protein
MSTIAVAARAGLVASALGLVAASAEAQGPVPLSHPGTLRVLVFLEEDRPQFFSMREGGAPGFEREILEGFARMQGLAFEVVPVPRWDALIPYLNEGRGDVIAGHFTDIPERRELVNFTSGVLPTRSVVITRKPRRAIYTLAALSGETIGVVLGSAARADLLAAGVPAARVVDSFTPNNVLTELRAGRITAHVRSLPEAVLAQREDAEIEIGMALGPAASFAFGVRKNNAPLRDALDRHLELLRSTGNWSRLVVKYFGDAAPEILKRAR